LIVANCAPGPDDFAKSIGLAEYVFHQQTNISTEWVSAVDSIGLDCIAFGLAAVDDPDLGRVFDLPDGFGRMQVFSADGDLTDLDLEMGLAGGSSDERMRMLVRLNDKRLRRVTLTPGLDTYRLEVPEGLAVKGRNRLELQARPSRRQIASTEIPQVRLRRVRFRSARARPFWPQRPERIRVVDAPQDPTRQTVEMPTASFVDMVLALPREAMLVGSVSSSTPADQRQRPVEVYIELVDKSLEPSALIHETISSESSQEHRFRIDLGSWAEREVSLRFGTTGTGNAMVRWHDVRVGSADSSLELELEPTIDPEPPPSSGRLGRPDIVVILVDAARADAFSPFGGEHPTPGLERLALDGTKFTEAISTSPWTGQSVPSMLTGLFADTLGIGGWGSELPVEPSTLAELLVAAGYRTALWSQHPIYRNRSGLQRGFDEVVISAGRSYDRVPEPSLLFDDLRPTFTWLHFIPPHTPYRPPSRFLGSYSSWYQGGISVEASFLSQFPHRIEPDSLGHEDLRYIRDRYLENAAFADELVQRVVELFDVSGRYEESMIVVLSDHGEAFLEHGRFLHTRHVYREFLQVPWVIKWPSAVAPFADQVDDVVALTDLVPTLVDGLGLEFPGPGFQGQSLLPLVLDGIPRSGPVYAVTRGDAHGSKPPLPESMLEVDGWRIVYDALADRSEIYRAREDPREQSDLARMHPMKALRLRQAMLRQLTRNRTLVGIRTEDYLEPDLDEETVEQLRALGYLD